MFSKPGTAVDRNSFCRRLIVDGVFFKGHIVAVDGRGDEALPPQAEAVVISFLRLAQMRNLEETVMRKLALESGMLMALEMLQSPISTVCPSSILMVGRILFLSQKKYLGSHIGERGAEERGEASMKPPLFRLSVRPTLSH